MAKKTFVNVGGTNKEVKNVWQNVGGTWKEGVIPKVNVGGFYRECMSYSTPRLYTCTIDPDDLYELDPDTLQPINTVSPPGTSPYGIGGTYLRLYNCDYMKEELYELDLDTLQPINTVSSPSTASYGIGGTKLITSGKQKIVVNKTELNGTQYSIDTILETEWVDTP